MRKFLLNILIFTPLTILLYLIFLVIFGYFAPSFLKRNLNYKLGGKGYLYTRLKEADTIRNVDILFLGSSHSYRGYDPRFFDKLKLKTFNLGSSAQTPIQTEILVNKYLRTINPKLVIFDVYPKVFELDGVESSLDLLANQKIDSRSLKLVFYTNNIKLINTYIFALFKQTLNLNKHFKENLTKDGDNYIKGGYVETYKVFKEDENDVYIPQKVIVSERQLRAFQQTVAILKHKGIKIIFVQSPLTQKRYNSFTNNRQIDSIFKSYGTYYNFNTILPLPDSLFSDDSHLNQKGVNLFNNKFLSIIEKQLK